MLSKRILIFMSYLLVYETRKSDLLIWGIFMWIITLYSNSSITMFEYGTQEEAREAFDNLKGFKILSEIVYFTDECFATV